MIHKCTTLEQKRARQGRYVKARLVEADIPLKAIAERAGVVRSLVTAVIKGRRSSVRVRRAIAAALNTPVEQLWPNDKAA